MRRRAALHTFFSGLLAVGLGACLSPTLPLPPPEEPERIQPSEEGGDVWIVSGSCVPGALVTVFNEETGKGALVEDTERTGRYSVELEATRCDLAWVAQVFEDEASGRTSFVIQEVTGSAPDDTGACK